jgi:periplasmic divalent cation tolerance protein
MLIVTTTVATDADAERIAVALVDAHLAACVQRIPGVVSTYRWNGRVESAPEILLSIKTTRERYPELAARLAELHPYELPELIAVEVSAGSPGYLDWVRTETVADGRGGAG